MLPTNDPGADERRHGLQAMKFRRTRPRCCGCGEPILQDHAFTVDGRRFCEDCQDLAWRRVRWRYVEEIE